MSMKNHIGQPSTLAGIAMILSMVSGLFGLNIDNQAVTAVSAAVGSVVGAYEVVRRERGDG